MSKAKQVAAIETEVERLEARIRQLKKQAAGIGYFLECAPYGMEQCGCGRKVFVAEGQNPPADWLRYHDWDFGLMHACADCASKHGDALRESGYERLGKTRSQRRRESLRRKRQWQRERTPEYWQEQVIFVAPGVQKAFLGTRLEMIGAFHAANMAQHADCFPVDLRYTHRYDLGTVYNPLREVPPEFAQSGLRYLGERGIVL